MGQNVTPKGIYLFLQNTKSFGVQYSFVCICISYLSPTNAGCLIRSWALLKWIHTQKPMA